MRVALFGGSFDPPHRGHVAIARAAADRFSLDRILFAPVGRQPLKSTGATASFEQRMAMIGLACAEDGRFAVSDLDAPRPDGRSNYTVDTLARLSASVPQARIFNLAGTDSFRDLARWHEPERLLTLAEWIVANRPGFPFTGNSPSPQGMTLSAEQRARIHLLGSVHEDVAATDLRQRLQAGDSCGDLLPPAVFAYIQRHGLYLAPRSGAEPSHPLP